jgi:hypothetical protein
MKKSPSAFDSKLILIQVVTYKHLVGTMKAKAMYERTQVNDILVMIVDEKEEKKEEKRNIPFD